MAEHSRLFPGSRISTSLRPLISVTHSCLLNIFGAVATNELRSKPTVKRIQNGVIWITSCLRWSSETCLVPNAAPHTDIHKWTHTHTHTHTWSARNNCLGDCDVQLISRCTDVIARVLLPVSPWRQHEATHSSQKGKYSRELRPILQNLSSTSRLVNNNKSY